MAICARLPGRMRPGLRDSGWLLPRDLYLRRMKGIGKRKSDQRPLSYVANQRGAEAGYAGAAGVANAGIDNSG